MSPAAPAPRASHGAPGRGRRAWALARSSPLLLRVPLRCWSPLPDCLVTNGPRLVGHLSDPPRPPPSSRTFPAARYIGAQKRDAIVDDDSYYTGGAYYYVQAADDDQE
ncbi:uncharacterized protein LOC125536442 [Triticum urartu]|uniref:uncharacterized protein LOC125536442 n=1 Tax=Triticum urartu TaxID=4572 RepID=UPI002043EE4D|nr:uncharacterized protein LOC125536442 [Triticum urartu]